MEISPGQTYPLGATVDRDRGGVNFCIHSKKATRIELLLFDQPNAPKPAHVIPLDPETNNTFYYWHIFVKGIKAGQVYAYRVDGPFNPERGHRFDKSKVLLDPYAKAIVGSRIYNRQAAIEWGRDNCAQALRGIVVDTSTYDWEGDWDTQPPLRIPYSQSVIYEMHVGGFTNHPNSGVTPTKRGTYAGLIQKIPYLKKLGITAVELLPVHYFDPEDAQPGRTNYWGYSTLSFFAPHRIYSSRQDSLGPLNEFRDMVKALHKAGIEVILDVVFNHTAEGDERGPTISFRGIDNKTYYILDRDNPAHYQNYTGCGNTFRGNHPIVARLILDSLRYWVSEMHVDGFRFDLAAVLTRDAMGKPLHERVTMTPDILWVIESDPILAGTKLIAEAWDAAGLYSLGKFVELADWFSEWNGKFRDDVRRFLRNDPGAVQPLANCILGSPDVYHLNDIDINRSINFITCHDGFTLNDLVSYRVKHNEANGEDNRDGCNDNFSYNFGVEGETDNGEIKALRLRQIKNFWTILFMSQGTPMILMGDEVQRTQKGNNNAYCQDNELSWFDWSGLEREKNMLRFVSKLIDFIQGLSSFQEKGRLNVSYASHEPHLVWHGTSLGEPDWRDCSHTLAFTLRHPAANEHLYVAFNAYWEALSFELPLLGNQESWYRIVDTALSAPEDFCDLETAPTITTEKYHLQGRSSIILMAK